MIFFSALALGVVYQMAPGASQSYEVSVLFQGYLPILGGREAKVQVNMGVEVLGLDPKPDGLLRSVSELKQFQVLMNDAELPFNLANVQSFFPKTTISFLPTGEVKATDAPDAKMPIRLPGLDAKRLPEISYLPLQLPTVADQSAPTFRFERLFGGTPVLYEVTESEVDAESIQYTIKLSQQSHAYETSQHVETTEQEKAKWDIRRQLVGNGKATFDRRTGTFQKVLVEANEDSEVRELRSGELSKRHLKTTLSIGRTTKVASSPGFDR
jgi:hypothetical protein